MSKIVMYCTAWCPYCIRAEQLLHRKGVDVEKIRVDKTPSLFDEMVAKTRRNTVPQIFIGDFHVGGYDDLVELDLEGELDKRLAEC